MVTPDQIREALRTVYDPELGLDIITLGLVYEITPSEDGTIDIRMTLTSRSCPLGPVIRDGVQGALKVVPGVTSVNIETVWEPAWSPESIEPEGKKRLGFPA